MAHSPPSEPNPAAARARPRILIVEDSVIVGMALESLCDSLGWEMVGPARSVAEGLAMAGSGGIDAALLDVSLGSEMAWDIAALLQARGTPFVFATGHDLTGRLPAEFAAIPILRKPFRMADIEQSLGTLLMPATPPGRSGL